MKMLLFRPAIRLRIGVGCLLLLSGMVSAQSSDTDPAPVDPLGVPFDDITNRDVVAERSVLPYQPIRESDILWEKRLWRIIDVREKMNLPFAFPNAPLAEILGTAALDGDITVFDPSDDQFAKPLDATTLRKALYRRDTLVTINVETEAEEVRIVEQAPDWSAIKRFRLKESWFFDTRTGTLRFRILGIAPLINVTNSEGDFLYERPLFWVHYPTSRTFLAHQKAYTTGDNLSATLTWEDVFEMRYFTGVVYKENNLYDRRIQDYLAGVDALFEASRINDALFNREQDAWSW